MDENWTYKRKIPKGLRPLHGFLLFLVVMLSFYTVIAWAQRTWGMYGLALTELYLLLLSVLAASLLRLPLKEIFPLKKPHRAKILAVFLCWISAYALVLPLTMTTAYFFPRQMFSVSGELNQFMASVPALLSIFISCVMPAVCEEALHRGFILKSFQSRWHSKWGLTISMGILFGLFHGSIWRFLPTAILGGVLTYLMLETENMLYPALFHFLNNFLPSLLSGFSGNGQQTARAAASLQQEGFPLFFLGIYIAVACIVPFGFYTASYLLHKGEANRRQTYLASNKTLVILVVCTVLPIIAGMFLFFYGFFSPFFL